MDSVILKALSGRSRFRQLRRAVPPTMVDGHTSALLDWFAVYFEAFPDHEYVQPEAMQKLVKLRCQGQDPASVAMLLHLVKKLEDPVDDSVVAGILGTLHELDLSGRAGAIIRRYEAGEDVSLAYELNRISTETVRSISQSAPTDYIDTPINEILSEITEDKGLKFRRIRLLREHIMGLQGGASIAIASRPDKGKTSLLADIATDFAGQIVEYFGEGRPILWLNNEGSGKRIIPRVYQAALHKDLAEIIALSNAGKLVEEYAKVVGNPSMIRVKDMHGASFAQVEQVIEAIHPAVVIGDMIANFRMPAGGGNKADDVERAWQEWREMMVRHDAIGLGTVQISQEGGNMLYPPYSALKDSKTGIQGATDVILMMGSLDNPDAATIRGISTPKNKFCPPGKQSYVTGEVYLDPSRCEFNDGGN